MAQAHMQRGICTHGMTDDVDFFDAYTVEDCHGIGHRYILAIRVRV